MDVLRCVYWVGLISTIMMMFSCGSGDNSASVDGDSSNIGTGFPISITDPSSGRVVDTSVVNLRGWAFCPECPWPKSALDHCPPISCPDTTIVDVSWVNRATGESGAAYHGIRSTCLCTFITGCISKCEHNWSASVPITIGPNVIAVAADEQVINEGDSVMITRVPPPPSDVVAVAGHDQVTVSWNNVPDSNSYNIYWSTSQTITTESASKITGVTTPYTLTGLTDNVPYYFLVTALNGDYESFVSDVAWATAGWFTEAVAETLDTTEQRDTSIEVDSAGNAHIHYSYDEHFEPSTVRQYNYYTTNKMGIWSSVFVDNPSMVNASIALDSSDIVNIGYLDFPGLTHAVYSSGNWMSEVIDSDAWCSSSVVLDSTDKLHAAYRASVYPDEVIRYANNISGSWNATTLDTVTMNCGGSRNLSFAVDVTGAAHIAYAITSPERVIKYVTNKSGVWSISNVDQVGNTVEQLSLTVDLNGNAHIAYADNISQLKYAHNVSGAWVIELLDSSGSPKHPSIAVDATGRAHIGYFHNQYGELRYTTNLSGVWRVIPIDHVGFTPPGWGTDTAIALDSQGNVYLSYFSGNSLKFATNR